MRFVLSRHKRCLTTTTTHFGSRTVPKEEKESLVRGVFSSVASNYDVMNDLMSGGMHRFWKDDFVKRLGVGTCARAQGKVPRVLDVAGGTGDIAFRVVEELVRWLPPTSTEKGEQDEDEYRHPIVVSDVNGEMLEVGRKRALERGISPKSLTFEEGNAERLPYEDNSFDFVTISFGLRNVTDIDAALKEMCRVLRPGGRFECLEFSKVRDPLLRTVYNVYSDKVIPELGERVAKDRGSYEYLVESIRKHPNQLELLSRLAAAGFVRPSFRDMTFGVVAVHSGYAPV